MLSTHQVPAELAQAGGAAMVERFARLDGLMATDPVTASIGPGAKADAIGPEGPMDFDVVLVGGGLSVLLAQALAQRGWRTAVYERAPRIEAHRAWNASRRELDALSAAGLLDARALDTLIAARYRHGICSWHGGSTTRVAGVLDCAVDAQQLLTGAVDALQARDAHIACGHEVGAMHAGKHGVRLAVRHDPHAPWRQISARVVLDGRGVQSPFARHDLLCPTVGGVFEGLDEGDGPHRIDPGVGEILVTREHVEENRQHIWEVFPCGNGRVAVYLFYYERARQRTPGALTALYRRFFAHLPRFKHGKAYMAAPAFGWIPGWSRLGRGARAPHPRVVLVGDAAARHSPLTFCGFGAMLRSIAPVTEGVHAFLSGDALRVNAGVDDRAIHRATGALACIMATPPHKPSEAGSVNALLSSAFTALHAQGPEAYAGLLQDTMPMGDFVRFLRRTSVAHPQVYRHVWRALGPYAASRWAMGLSAAMARQSRGDARDALPA